MGDGRLGRAAAGLASPGTPGVARPGLARREGRVIQGYSARVDAGGTSIWLLRSQTPVAVSDGR